MASKVEIFNLALGRIGAESTIESFDENSTEAGYARAVYNPNREATLREHDWGFARQYVLLVKLAAPIARRWVFAYKYPNTAVRVIDIERPQTSATVFTNDPDEVRTVSDQIAYEVAQDADGVRSIHCNLDNAIARVTVDEQEPSKFDPSFVDALAWRMAKELATTLGARTDYYTLASREYEGAIERAKSATGKENASLNEEAAAIKARR